MKPKRAVAIVACLALACVSFGIQAIEPGDGFVLIAAATRGDLAAVTALLKQPMGKPDSFQYVDAWSNRIDALIAAAENGHLQVVQALLAAKVDAGGRKIPKQKLETSPLIAASDKGHLDVVEALLAANADVNFVDPSGRSALSWAVLHRQVEVVKVLLAAKADTEVTEKITGRTLLLRAISSGSFEAARLLLDAGADVNARATGGETALMMAARWDEPESLDILRHLLAVGAVVNAATPGGTTALAVAVREHRPRAALILREAGGVASVGN